MKEGSSKRGGLLVQVLGTDPNLAIYLESRHSRDLLVSLERGYSHISEVCRSFSHCRPLALIVCARTEVKTARCICAVMLATCFRGKIKGAKMVSGGPVSAFNTNVAACGVVAVVPLTLANSVREPPTLSVNTRPVGASGIGVAGSHYAVFVSPSVGMFGNAANCSHKSPQRFAAKGSVGCKVVQLVAERSVSVAKLGARVLVFNFRRGNARVLALQVVTLDHCVNFAGSKYQASRFDQRVFPRRNKLYVKRSCFVPKDASLLELFARRLRGIFGNAQAAI